MTHDPQTRALDWLIRQRDPDFAEWDAFADWLGADPDHAAAYHELAALDADLDDLPQPEAAPVAPTMPDNVVPLAPRRASRRVWLSGALAASLVAVLSVGLLRTPSDDYRVETAMGETQTIRLDDGSRISVNGGSTILLSHADPRKATLERGQALFHVVHRDDAPFRVTVGDRQLVDIGTVFDVTRTDDRTVVAVSEGAVIYDPRGENVRVDAGRRLAVRDDARDKPVVSTVSNDMVGGWQAGQLVYDGTPLAEVAAEVARTTGIAIRTTPAVSAIPFRGALQTGTSEAQLVSDLAALSGTRSTQDNGGWTLSK